MRYLGIDYGTKHIGIAVSDERGSIAFPREPILNGTLAVNDISDIVSREEVEEIVIGDSLTLSGEANTITEACHAFIKKLESDVGLPVHSVREAWSSAEAMRYAPKGKRHEDSSAAAIILQRFLDAKPKTK